jgi:hypothetical protein
MAQETLVTEAFSDQMVKAGAHLLQRLDNAALQIGAALWIYIPEAGRWRFIIATPHAKLDGPRKLYRKIQSVLAKIPQDQPSIDLQSVTVVDTSEPLIALLRSAVRTGGGISGIRFSRNMIDGVMIEDAYIYRLT